MSKKVLLSSEVEMEIPFQDVDAMQVVWHGNYFRYFEAARSMLLRKINYDYTEMRDSNYLWPIIGAHLRFVQAARYRQHILVKADLVEWENRLKIDYLIRDAENGVRLTTGYTIQCAVNRITNELQLVSPPDLTIRLTPYL
ncbi:thioesterase superfamily protein [mine drainage metagenome]|uniref:Thioesterase superfamily protein n=1 Tax=mine drainage metagenome TaxID=410659 RepID=T1B9S9_9ZZZZ